MQFTGLFLLVILGAVFLCWILNQLFLERYYLWERHKRLIADYGLLQEAAKAGELGSEEFALRLREIADRDEIGIIVMDNEAVSVTAYVTDDQTLMRRMWDNLLGLTPDLPKEESENDGESAAASAASTPEPSPGITPGHSPQGQGGGWTNQYYLVSTEEATDSYRVQIVLDSVAGTQAMEMWGILEDGSFFLMRTAIESLRLSTAVASRFLAISGILTACLGAVAAYGLARYVSDPIRRLTAISDRMKRLDFSAKYEGKTRTEVADLGRNINELSVILEDTIGELKSANRELQEDIARREQAEEMRQEFLSGVTHELKTPLALIQGYAEGLQEGVADDPESTRYYCDVIVDEAGRMNSMVKRLLTLNQLEFGSNNVEMVRFDIVTMIRSYLDSAEVLAEKEGIRVQFRNTKPVYVWSDEFMSREVFSNYFTNALHHADGEKVIDINLKQKKNCVRITVFNTGQKIPEDALPHIWEQFYKVDKARTREYGGNGVGLAIVKAIMGLLHQDYGVNNYENGVAFWFELDSGAPDPA